MGPGAGSNVESRAELESPHRLPRALRALAHEAVVTEARASPSGRAGAVVVTCELVVLAGRATHVP
jgi:hypothetical protein